MTILTEMAKIKLLCCCLLLLPATFSATTDDDQLLFSSTATAPNNFHWHSLFNTSAGDDHFADLFLPPYLSFDKLILQTPSELNISLSFSHHHQLLSQPCQRSLQQALEALANRQSWAVELFNAWAQAYPPTGAASGTLSDLGDFDQCLDLVSPKMSTKYCLLDYHFPMPRPRPKHHNFYHQTPNLLPSLENEQDYQLKSRSSFYRKLEQVSPLFYYTSIQIAICLPSTCSSEDVFIVGSKGIIDLGLVLDKTSTTSKGCQQKEGPFSWNSLNSWQAAAVIFIVALCLLTLLGALVDRLYREKEEEEKKKYSKNTQLLLKCLRCFSPLSNGRRLLKLKTTTAVISTTTTKEEKIEKEDDDDEDQLAVVHGLRFLTLLIIIVGHALDWNGLNMFRSSFSVPERVSSLLWQPLYRGQLTVDTFFYLSGLLTSYITLKYTGGQYSRFSYLKYLLLRYLRLTPQLAAFLLITALLPKLLDQGPVMVRYSDRLFADHCYDNWWLNLLFVQNLIRVESICALHTWFLAADMQLHVLALPPLVTLLLNRKSGVRLATAMLVCSVLWSSLTVYLNELPPGAIITSKADFLDERGMPSEYLRFCYHPFTHAHVFLIGFLFGNYIREHSKELRRWRLSWQLKYSLWAAVFTGYLLTIYSMLPWLYGRPYNPLISAIVFPANLALWSLVLTAAIGLCLTGNGSGVVGKILSTPSLKPLSRLTYSVYLTHVWVLLVALGGRREVIDLHFGSLVCFLLSIVLLSFGVGFVFSVLVENPVLHAIDFLKEVDWSSWLVVGRQQKTKKNRRSFPSVVVTKFKPLEASLLFSI